MKISLFQLLAVKIKLTRNLKKKKKLEDLDNRDDSRKKKNKVISNPTYYTVLPTYYKYIGVEMATHSSTLAQKITWTEEPGA